MGNSVSDQQLFGDHECSVIVSHLRS